MTQQEAMKELVDYAMRLNTTAESQREIEAIQCCLAKSIEVIMDLDTYQSLCRTNYGQCEHWDKRTTGCEFCTETYKERKI